MPIIAWSRTANATSYEVEVDDSSDFSTPIVRQRTVNHRFVPTQNLPAGAVYYRVRATSSSGTSGWARGQAQVPSTPPPVPLSPVDGESLSQPNRPPLLQWQPVAGAVGYDIEVDSDGNWIDQASYTSKGASFSLPEPQAPGAWEWRVRAQRGNGLVTQWSTPAAYQVEPLTPVTVLGPTGSARVQDVVLSWEPVAGASKYEVRIGRDQDFSNTVEVVTVFGTRYSPGTTYLNDGYFWQVRPIDQAGRKLAWPDEAPSTFIREWPQKPTLLHPADRIDLPVGDSFYYQWSPVPHATRYQLDVGTDPNFSPTTYNTCTTAGTTYTAGYLTPTLTPDKCMPAQGAVTYWRVRAIDAPASVQGIYSQVRRFIYESAVVNQLSPAEGAEVATPVLRWEAARDAERYFVEVRRANGTVQASATTYALSWAPTGTSDWNPEHGPFSWTVQAVDADKRRSPLYPARSFTLAAPVEESDAPLTPHPVSDGVRVPALTWEPMPGAAYYKLRIKVAGTGFWLNTSSAAILRTSYPYPAASDTDEFFLSPGSFEWQVQAFSAGHVPLGDGPLGAFEILDLPGVTGQQIALDGQSLDQGRSCGLAIDGAVDDSDICQAVPATPVLDWDPVPGAAFYMVYLAEDHELTNLVLPVIPRTQNTRWTPHSGIAREALADNESGKAYFWYVRACKSASACSADPVSSNASATHAFRKLSPSVQPLTPSADSTVTDVVITFDWEDYQLTNSTRKFYDGPHPSHQTAMQYEIHVSQTESFSGTNTDTRIVDQSTYTAAAKTYPEGDLYWRVRAIDAEGNRLSWSPISRVVKDSPAVTLVPFGSSPVPGDTPFRWAGHAFNATYEIEVYANNDSTFSPGNQVIRKTGLKTTAYVPPTLLAPSPVVAGSAVPYLWRVRSTDPSGNVGRWTAPGTLRVRTGIVSLVAPAAGVRQLAAGPLFIWQATAHAAGYRVEYRSAGSTRTSYATTVATAWAPTAKLATGASEWRVMARDASGNTIGTSPWRSFTVDAPPPVDRTAPVATLKKPGSPARRKARFVVVFSEPVTGLTRKRLKLHLGSRKVKARLVVASSRTKATLKPRKRLKSGRTYTLRLGTGVKDAAGNSARSTSWTVRVR